MLPLILSSASAMTLEVPELARGEVATFVVTGAQPNRRVTFVAGTDPGNGPCPGVMGGTCLGVLNPVNMGHVSADASGRAEFTVTMPAAVAVGDYAFQAVQTTPVVQVTPVVEAPILWDMAVGDPPLIIGAAAGDGDYLRHGQTVSITRTAASLPHLQSAVLLKLSTELPDLPALTTVNQLETYTGGTITLPAWTGGDHVLGTIDVWNRSRALTLSAPLLDDINTIEVDSSYPVDLYFPPGARVLVNLTVSGTGTGQTTLHEVVSVDYLSQLHSAPMPILPDLTSVNYSLSVSATQQTALPSLTTHFPQLVSVGYVVFGSNPVLTDLSPWSGLLVTQCQNATGGAIIRSNASLPDCDAEAFIDAICPLNQGYVGIDCHGNLADACTGMGVCVP